METDSPAKVFPCSRTILVAIWSKFWRIRCCNLEEKEIKQGEDALRDVRHTRARISGE